MRSYIVKLAASDKKKSPSLLKRTLGYAAAGTVGGALGLAAASRMGRYATGVIPYGIAGSAVGSALADIYMREKQSPIKTLANTTRLTAYSTIGGTAGFIAGAALGSKIGNPGTGGLLTPLAGQVVGSNLGKLLATKQIIANEKHR